MKKYVSKFKSVCVKALVIGSCLTFIATSTSLAESAAPGSVDPAPRAVQSEDGYGSEALRDKHEEVNAYLFEQNKGEFNEYKITHTGPHNGFIEIGITPYEETHAESLYELFGKELVKVVEGQQAVTMELPVATVDEPMNGELSQKHQEVDQFLFEENEGSFPEKGFNVTHTGPHDGYMEIGITPYEEANANYLYDIFGEEQVKIVEGQQAETFTTTEVSENAADAAVQTIALNGSPTDSNSSTNLFLIGSILLAVIVLGAAAYFARRLRASK